MHSPALFAMASLLHENVDAVHRTGRQSMAAGPSSLRRSSTLVTRSSRVVADGHRRARFRDASTASSKSTRRETERRHFRVVYGTSGALRGASHGDRPNWWAEVTIVLVDRVQ
jgi:hypothetical protein